MTKKNQTVQKPPGHSRAMRPVNFVLDMAFLTLMLVLLLFAGYARWDSEQVFTTADPVHFIKYKPSPPEMVPFEKLQEINPEVLGWLTVYDTNIDYPLVIGKDNEKYLNRNAELDPANSGSLFLDYRNHRDFSDFNTIVFGHHMAHHEMFGDLDLFLEESFWNNHEYGNLIYNGRNHGLEFVAMLQCDAYDFFIYKPDIKGENTRIKYINHIYETAKYVRGIPTDTLRDLQRKEEKRAAALKKAGKYDTGEDSVFTVRRTSPVTPDDHLLLLSTCSAEITNGRFILVAKILDTEVENPFPETNEHKVRRGIDSAHIAATIGKWKGTVWILVLALLILLLVVLYRISRHYDQKRFEREGEKNHDTNNL